MALLEESRGRAQLAPELRARASMMEIGGDAEAVTEFLHILEEHRQNCVRQGKYIEADIAAKRLKELKQHEENRKQEGLRSTQISQRLAIEESHMIEFQEFNSMWDSKMKEYELRAGELLEAMRQRHVLDQKEFKRRAGDEPQRKPKFSKELLDLRCIEVTLAKQGAYVDAQKVKERADALEDAELERIQAERAQHAANAEVKFLQKQEQELSALRQRIQAGAEEQRKARKLDLERLLQRYNNTKAELEAIQNTERHKQRKGLSHDGSLATPRSRAPRTPASRPASAAPKSSKQAASKATPKAKRPIKL